MALSNLQLHAKSLSTDANLILTEFTKPIMDNIFFINKSILINSVDTIKTPFIPIWDMNPQMFCLDTYKEENIYPIVLLVNNISCIFDFNMNISIIITPSIRSIYKVLSQR